MSSSPVGVLLESWTPPAQDVYHEPWLDLQSQSRGGGGGGGKLWRAGVNPWIALGQRQADGRQGKSPAPTPTGASWGTSQTTWLKSWSWGQIQTTMGSKCRNQKVLVMDVAPHTFTCTYIHTCLHMFTHVYKHICIQHSISIVPGP